jgi:hypothetical protein
LFLSFFFSLSCFLFVKNVHYSHLLKITDPRWKFKRFKTARSWTPAGPQPMTLSLRQTRTAA